MATSFARLARAYSGLVATEPFLRFTCYYSNTVGPITINQGSGIIGSSFSSCAVVNLDERSLEGMRGTMDSALKGMAPKSLLCIPLEAAGTYFCTSVFLMFSLFR